MGLKFMFFGIPGSGKTYALVQLLLRGYKLAVVSTDVGGEGLLTIELALAAENRTDLLDNVYFVTLENHEELEAFIKTPELFMPEIYDFDPDFLVWEGASNWQQVMAKTVIGDMVPQRAGGKEVSDARASGLQFEQADWGMLTNLTMRMVDGFCKLNNRKTGKVWHKIVNAHEGSSSKGNGTGGFVDTLEPLFQGAAKKMMGAAFDLILRTRIRKAKGEEAPDSDGRVYEYVINPHDNLLAKNRGFKLDSVMPADFGKVWDMIQAQRGHTSTVNPEFVEKVEE